ncbi:MAG: heavy-metal-associated domain-containing protein [Oscillospiraceae bacterium]
MKTIQVPDMHCAMCTARIEKAFSAAGIAYTASLDDHTVTVEDGQLSAAMGELEDLGFTPAMA